LTFDSETLSEMAMRQKRVRTMELKGFNSMSNNEMYFPEKLVMVAQKAPYNRAEFVKVENGYELMVTTLKEPIFLTRKEFIKSVVDHKEKFNYKVISIQQ
jgi:hypothetical protein